MVKLTINNKLIEVPEDTTVLEAAKMNGILIPHFCYLKNIHQNGSCRMCIVEIEGERTLKASCITKVREGMVVQTNTKKVRDARKIILSLIMSDHNKECLVCSRNGDCELQDLCELMQVHDEMYTGEKSSDDIDTSNPSIVRDMTKCIMCRRCETVCNDIQGVGVINSQNRGFKTVIGPTEGFKIMDLNCTYCGQCTLVCPVGALTEKDSTEEVWEAIYNPDKRVVVQTAPAIRAALGEEFGYEPGTCVTGKMSAALRLLGFDDIFDTNFAADLTIMEEGSEFLKRIKDIGEGKPQKLPMITSCSPGWVKFIEHNFPNQLGHVSSCKSPHMMLGALAKSYYAEQLDMNPDDIFVVSVMPCTAKKYEITRKEMEKDVDAVITTRELAKMIKSAGIDFNNLDDEKFDSPFGISTGAADIFGTTGGVMEAAIRTIYEIVTGEKVPFENLHIESIMGLDDIKQGELKIEKTVDEWKSLEGETIKVAVASGLKSAKVLLDQIKDGKSPYHFIEIMCCPGGCINGGGQPRSNDKEIIQKRLEALYTEDEGKQYRKSHENPAITKIYEDYLKKPLGHKSHELLHTHYVKRGKFNELVE